MTPSHDDQIRGYDILETVLEALDLLTLAKSTLDAPASVKTGNKRTKTTEYCTKETWRSKINRVLKDKKLPKTISRLEAQGLASDPQLRDFFEKAILSEEQQEARKKARTNIDEMTRKDKERKATNYATYLDDDYKTEVFKDADDLDARDNARWESAIAEEEAKQNEAYRYLHPNPVNEMVKDIMLHAVFRKILGEFGEFNEEQLIADIKERAKLRKSIDDNLHTESAENLTKNQIRYEELSQRLDRAQKEGSVEDYIVSKAK